VLPSEADFTPALRAWVGEHFDLVPHSRRFDAFLVQAVCHLASIYDKTTDDAAIPASCLLSLMGREFTSHHTWLGIAMPSFSASNPSHIACRPSCHFPCTTRAALRGILYFSQESFSSTSTTPLSTDLVAVMMMSRLHRAISAVAFWCVTAVIAPLAFLLGFMILIWAGACWWESALLIAEGVSWSIIMGSGTVSSHLGIRCLSARLNLVARVGCELAGPF